MFKVFNSYGKLNKVLMHRPGSEVLVVTDENADQFCYNSAVDIGRFQYEYDCFLKCLRECGVEPVLIGEVLKDDAEACSYISKRPNIHYTRDLSSMVGTGIVLMGMQEKCRKWDQWLVRRVAEKLGIPVHGEIGPDGILEGGGVELLTDRILVAGLCDRANEIAFEKLKKFVLGTQVDELAVVMVPEGCIHIDGLFLPIDERLVIANREYLNRYPCIIYRKDSQRPYYSWFVDYMEKKEFEIIDITFEEGAKCAANYIQVGPRKLVGYEGNDRVEREIRKRGGTVITFPGGELIKGRGGPHCMTCPIDREI